jgi:hypothetical protein
MRVDPKIDPMDADHGHPASDGRRSYAEIGAEVGMSGLGTNR